MKTEEKNYFCELTEEESVNLDGGKITWGDVVSFLARAVIITGPIIL